MKIAVLGWGSLLWDEEANANFDQTHCCWKYDGPELKIEFSRISKTRGGALTLVVDKSRRTRTRVAWCLSKRSTLDDAICDLQCREGTNRESIGSVCTKTCSAAGGAREPNKLICKWGNGKRLDAVIWTALKSNFCEESRGGFSVKKAIAYLQSLDAKGKAAAAEYVWRAPDFVRTPLRRALERKPWFASLKPKRKRRYPAGTSARSA